MPEPNTLLARKAGLWRILAIGEPGIGAINSLRSARTVGQRKTILTNYRAGAVLVSVFPARQTFSAALWFVLPAADTGAYFRGNGEKPDKILDAAVSRSTVTRDDLAHAIYARLPGLSRAEAKALLDCTLEEMLSALARGEDLSLRRFGTFRIRSKSARPGRNPKTGADALISSRRVVVFKAAPHLKSAVAATRSVQPADDPP